MQNIPPDGYRLRGNWIQFADMPWQPVQIPFGLGLGIRDEQSGASTRQGHYHRRPIRAEVRNAGVKRIDVSVDGNWRRVLPAFAIGISLRNPKCSVSIEAAITDQDRSAAQTIVARNHYLNPRITGFILIARVHEAAIREMLRTERWENDGAGDRPSVSPGEAYGGTGDVVGALHLERLLHGNPKGREAIYESLKLPVPETPAEGEALGFRHRIAHELGLYWISRVAVDAPFRKLGIGTLLCDAARLVAKDWMPERGRYVELIRRMPVAEFERIGAGSADFLTGHSQRFQVTLPYRMRLPFLSSIAAGPQHHAVGNTQRSCLAYYYAKAGAMAVTGAKYVRSRNS